MWLFDWSLWFFFHSLSWMHEPRCKNNALTTWMFARDDVMISGRRPCLHEIVSDGCFSPRIPLQGDTARHQIRAWQWHSPSVISGTRRSQGSMCFPQRDPGKGRSIGGRQELPDVSKSSAERKKQEEAANVPPRLSALARLISRCPVNIHSRSRFAHWRSIGGAEREQRRGLPALILRHEAASSRRDDLF